MANADSQPRPQISVVIPVYHSARTLPELIARLLPVLDRMGDSYEVILVEDGSKDQSWEVLSDLQRAHPDRLVAVQLMRNFGQHNALMCGFRHARGDFIVTMDDDLQNPPEEIPKLLHAIRSSDMDVVYGSYLRKKQGFGRNFGSWVVNAFFRLVFRIPVTVGPFRVIRRVVVESIFSYTLNYTFIDGLLAWNTQRIGSMTVEHHERVDGRSGYSLLKLVTLALNLFTNFSLLPLQFISGLGFFAAAAGMLLGLYYIVQYFLSNVLVPGYASLIATILFLGGVQLVSLGVIGEYLGRLHLNVNRKPQYCERQVIAGPTASEPKSNIE